MYESPISLPIESPETTASQPEAQIVAEDRFAESALRLAFENILAQDLTQNNRPIRHHETSGF